ncbi:MAG: hypothetical protein JNL70_26785 [Saprospiraceae bacterium]|nr:hypothetical protein [Saprospiraceae bacterium]
MKTNINVVKQKIAEADLNEAFLLLASSLDNTEHSDSIIIWQGRYNRLLKDKKLGAVSDSDFDTDMSKISLTILDLLKTLKSDFLADEVKINPSLFFFESDLNQFPDYKDRVYAQSFKNENTRAVGWELRMQFAPLTFPLSIGSKWRVLKPDQTYSAEYNSDFTIPEKWGGFWVQRTYGYAEAAKWHAGTYTIEVFVDNAWVGKGSFTIV